MALTKTSLSTDNKWLTSAYRIVTDIFDYSSLL